MDMGIVTTTLSAISFMSWRRSSASVFFLFSVYLASFLGSYSGHIIHPDREGDAEKKKAVAKEVNVINLVFVLVELIESAGHWTDQGRAFPTCDKNAMYGMIESFKPCYNGNGE